MSLSRALVVLALLILATGCQALAPEPQPPTDVERAEQLVDRWLSAMSGAEGDRGFGFLHPAAATESVHDRYVRALRDFEPGPVWRVVPESNREGSDNNEFFVVFVEVSGGSTMFPQGLFDAGLMQRYTVDQDDEGLIVIVKSDGAGTGIWVR